MCTPQCFGIYREGLDGIFASSRQRGYFLVVAMGLRCWKAQISSRRVAFVPLENPVTSLVLVLLCIKLHETTTDYETSTLIN